MTSPGKGRYTDYISEVSPRNKRLYKLFNSNPMTSDKGETRGDLYETKEFLPTDVTIASNVVVKRYVETIATDIPYANVEGNLKYFIESPNTKNLDITEIKGPPANAYMPDLNSPGASADGRTNLERAVLTDKKEIINKIGILPEDYKPFLIISPDTTEDKFTIGTVSPHTSGPIVGTVSVGSSLTMGSSIKK